MVLLPEKRTAIIAAIALLVLGVWYLLGGGGDGRRSSRGVDQEPSVSAGTSICPAPVAAGGSRRLRSLESVGDWNVVLVDARGAPLEDAPALVWSREGEQLPSKRVIVFTEREGRLDLELFLTMLAADPDELWLRPLILGGEVDDRRIVMGMPMVVPVPCPGKLVIHVACDDSVEGTLRLRALLDGGGAPRGGPVIDGISRPIVCLPSALLLTGRLSVSADDYERESVEVPFVGPTLDGQSVEMRACIGERLPVVCATLEHDDGTPFDTGLLTIELGTPTKDQITWVKLQALARRGATVRVPLRGEDLPGVSQLRFSDERRSEEAIVDLPTPLARRDTDLGFVRLRIEGVVGTGRVSGEGEGPLETATVWLAPLKTKAANKRIAVDVEGAFEIRGDPPGKYAVWATCPGYATETRSVELPASEPLLFTLSRGDTVAGSVLTDDAAVLPLLYIEVSDGVQSRTTEISLAGFSIGAFARTGSGFTVKVLCRQLDWPIVVRELARSETAEITIDLRGKVRVLSRPVRDASGPLQQANLRVSDGYGRTATVQTDARGRVDLAIPSELGSILISRDEERQTQVPIDVSTEPIRLD